jgi:hypothetical protein
LGLALAAGDEVCRLDVSAHDSPHIADAQRYGNDTAGQKTVEKAGK